MVKVKKTKIIKLPKSKRSVGGKKPKVRRSDAGAGSIPGLDAAFPGTGMPATPAGVPDLPMPNPAMPAGPGAGPMMPPLPPGMGG